MTASASAMASLFTYFLNELLTTSEFITGRGTHIGEPLELTLDQIFIFPHSALYKF